MNNVQNSKHYDLEDRTLKFARDARALIKSVPRTVSNIEDCKQLTRSSGSTGANYIEANEALSKKDFVMRIKICRKESKESKFWLLLIDIAKNTELEETRDKLVKESSELTKIFGAIIEKCK